MMNFEATACIRRGRGTTAAATVNLDFRGNVGHVTSMRTLAAQPPMKEASASAFIGFGAFVVESSGMTKTTAKTQT